MASQEIITDYNELSERAYEIAIASNREEVEQIVSELKDTIFENHLTHLTAPQIGYGKRIFCINFGGDIRTFINPMIIRTEEFVLSREHCASLENDYIIPRHKEIVAAYQTPTGKSESNRFLEPVSHIFEQCQDLLDGVLLCDYGLEITPEFDEATDSEKEEVIEYYLKALTGVHEELEKQIEGDEWLKKTRDAIDFMDSVIKGETKMEDASEEEKPVKLNRSARRLIKKFSKRGKKLVN